MELTLRRAREYFEENLPLGDRPGECFYAVWMVVVTLGLLGNVAGSRGELLAVIALAFSVNTVWGIIDGLSVMYGNLINRANNDQLVYGLQTHNDPRSRESAMEALDGTIASGLSREQKERIVDETSPGTPERDPYVTPYRPGSEDRHYALGIVAIDVLFVIPLVAAGPPARRPEGRDILVEADRHRHDGGAGSGLREAPEPEDVGCRPVPGRAGVRLVHRGLRGRMVGQAHHLANRRLRLSTMAEPAVGSSNHVNSSQPMHRCSIPTLPFGNVIFWGSPHLEQGITLV